MIHERDQQCSDCGGSGLYVGMAEGKRGGAIVCYHCKGTGCQHIREEYEPFAGQKPAPAGVRHVYAVNPGIVVDDGHIVLGGVPLSEWQQDPQSPFSPGREMREHTCPVWWYQTADYKKKPNTRTWPCEFGMFSQCSHFADKAQCWARWDAENEEAMSSIISTEQADPFDQFNAPHTTRTSSE